MNFFHCPIHSLFELFIYFDKVPANASTNAGVTSRTKLNHRFDKTGTSVIKYFDFADQEQDVDMM